MAGQINQYADHKIIDHVTGVTSLTPPTLYIGYTTDIPTSSVTGSTANEPTSGSGQQYVGYVRESLPSSSMGSPSMSGVLATIVNTSGIAFPGAGSGSTGTTLNGFIITDSATQGAGNVYFQGELDNPIPVSTGSTPAIDIGELSFSFSTVGGLSEYLAQKMLAHIFGTSTLTSPSNLYLAILTVTPTAGMTGATVTEPTTGSGQEYFNYVRTTVPSTQWGSATVATPSVATTSGGIITAIAVGAGSTGTVMAGIAMFDSATYGAGNMFFYSGKSAQLMSAGVAPFISSGGFTISG